MPEYGHCCIDEEQNDGSDFAKSADSNGNHARNDQDIVVEEFQEGAAEQQQSSLMLFEVEE